MLNTYINIYLTSLKYKYNINYKDYLISIKLLLPLNNIYFFQFIFL